MLSIGQNKASPELTLVEDYQKKAERLGRSVGITGITRHHCPESKRRNAAERRAEEAARLKDATPGQAAVVALSERGKVLSSVDFAQWLRDAADTGTQDVCFLIGGPDGHDPAFEQAADLKLSLGRMTWPHRLVRVMLMEQIYRAVTILAKHPYHRS